MPHDLRSNGLARAALAGALTLAITGGALTALAVQGHAATTSAAQLRASVVQLTNQARAAKGCKALKKSGKLTRTAQGHADDMSAQRYFSHTSKNGRTWDRRIREEGFEKPGGQNIARGFSSARGVHRAWMDSPGHRRNILNCDLRYIGVGYEADGLYWVQDFGY